MELNQQFLNIVVIGSGTMGTALSHLIAAAGHVCTLLTEEKHIAETINTSHHHPVFFANLTLHHGLKAATNWDAYIPFADLLVMAVPSYTMRKIAQRISPLIRAHHSVLSVTKGFEPETYKLMSEVLQETLPTIHIGTLSGPNITLDLVKNLPTELLISSPSPQLQDHGQRALTSSNVKIIVSEDLRSFEYISALKNIVALEVGIVTGLALGDNFRALVLAKGMAEISQLLAKMGLNSGAFYGLAGLSDIFLTCSSHFAHNYAIGVQLGTGTLLSELVNNLQAKGEVAEGLESLKAGLALVQQYNHTAPLLKATYNFIYHNSDAQLLKTEEFLAAIFNI